MDCRLLILVLVAAAATALAPTASAWDWNQDWRMRGDVYKTLDFSVRAGIDRATHTFSKGVDAWRNPSVSVQDRIYAFRLAGAEWRKVQVQSETGDFDERILSYALFMQGCSSEMANDSNAAIKMFSEVIELYPDILWVSLPARLRLACVHLSMGEMRKADAVLEELLDDPQSLRTIARADALQIAGDRMWNAGKLVEAQKCWREIMSDDMKCAGSDRRNGACARLMSVAMAKGDYDWLEELHMFGREDNDKERIDAVRRMFDMTSQFMRGNYGFWGVGGRMEKLFPSESERKKRIQKTRDGFFPWFDSKRPLYESTGRSRTYLFDSLRVAKMMGSAEEIEKRCKAIEKAVSSTKEPAKFAGEAKNVFCQERMFDYARKMPDYEKNPTTAAWWRYEIEIAAGKYGAAAVHLEEYIARKPSPEAEKKAKYELAKLCRDYLGKYDKAIALFQEVADPPRTLWDLHNTYRKAGKKKESYQMLVELESVFPNEAPRAFWTHAQCLEQDGDKKQAIALYRRLLSQPEWKKTQESSWAHQALERHGIATGGAVVNEVR